MTFSGTSFVTTLPAPTIELALIVIPGKIVTFPPIQTSFLIVIAFDIVDFLFFGAIG